MDDCQALYQQIRAKDGTRDEQSQALLEHLRVCKKKDCEVRILLLQHHKAGTLDDAAPGFFEEFLANFLAGKI